MSRDVVVSCVAAASWCGAFGGLRLGGGQGFSVLVGVLLIGMMVCALLAARRRSTALTRAIAILLLLCLCATSALAAASWLRVRSADSSPVAALAAQSGQARTQLVITGDPIRLRDGSGLVPGGGLIEGSPRGYRVDARVESLIAGGRSTSMRARVLLLVPQSWSGLVPGTRVESVLRWVPAREVGVAGVGIARTGPRVLAGPPALQEAAQRLRIGLMRAATESNGSDGAALVPALVVGDTAALPETVVDDMRASGLSHVTAVSGANVAIVLALMLLLARWIGVRGAWLLLIGLLSVAFFVVLARPEPSVLRAAVMGVITLAAVLRGGQRRPVGALAAAVVLLLVIDPLLAAELGFVLSVLATAGLVLIAPWWVERLRSVMPLRLAQGLAIAVGAQLMVSPVIAAVSGRLEPVALLANVLAEPAVAPATVFGFLAALVSPVSPTIAHWLAWCAVQPAAWIVAVAQWCSSLPAATLPWPSGWLGGLSIALLIAACAAAVVLRARRSAAIALIVGVLALLLLPSVGASRWPARDWSVLACAVGQGDAVLLRTGGSSAMLIDAGPDARLVDRCLRDAGIRRLDAIVLTHFHIDHIQGLAGAMHGRSVGPVLVSPLLEPLPQSSFVAALAAGAGSQKLVVQQGAAASIGPWQLTVLAPASDAAALRVPDDSGSPPNNASVVLLAQRPGLRVLLTGDVELTAQRGLVESWATAISNVDVLKVPHHGSAVQDPKFLALTAPRLALITVGERNRYGHPSPVTMSALEGMGTLIGRTDQDGDVAVVGGVDGRLRLVRRGL